MTDLSPKSADRLVKALKKASRADGWQNVLTGLGGNRDKSKYTKWVPNLRFLQPEFLDFVYAENDLAQTIVGAIVDDALREGIELKGPEGKDPAKAMALLEEHDVVGCVAEGATWGRLYGRGGLFLVIKGAGLTEDPLIEGQGELIDLIVVDKRELQPKTYYQDPTAEKFGQPETYTLSITASPTTQSPGIVVHESRLILFGGMRTPKRFRAALEGADLSVLQPVFDVLKKAEGNYDAVCSALTDMSRGVIKIKGLIEAIAAGKQDALAARFELMDATASMLRMLPLDAEDEDFKYVERGSLGGIKDLLDAGWGRVATAAHMPVTRLFQVSATGMDATGEGERINWYDEVRAYQRTRLKPALQRLVNLICGPGWEVCFPPLEKQDPLEDAQIQQAQAATDNLYFTMGALTPSEIAITRFAGGHWNPGYNGIDLEAHEAALKHELETLQEPPPEVDPATGLPVGEVEGTPSEAPPDEEAKEGFGAKP